MAPVGWSNLPSELVAEIADRLPSRTYQLRLRSVCSAWRAALRHHPNHRHHRPYVSLIPNCASFYPTFPANTNIFLIRRQIFLLSPPNPNPNPNSMSPWLIKTEQIHDGKFRLVHPFSRFPIDDLSTSFPKVINLSNVRILELGHEYMLYFDCHDPSRRFYRERVAYLPVGNDDDFVVLTIHMSAELAMYHSVDKEWTCMYYMGWRFYDVVSFNGMFYAVDLSGRTVAVNPDSGDFVTVVHEPVLYGVKNHLVQIGNQLMLAEMYDIESEEEENQGDGSCFVVFKLDMDGKKWDEIDDLGDRVLFLGKNSTFSASASDLKWYDSKGNYICYCNMEDLQDYKAAYQSVRAYDMNTGMDCYHDHRYYSKLFWPVPSWITSTP